jgi:hypothetical protein
MKSFKTLVKLERHQFLTFAFEVDAWLASRFARFTTKKRTRVPIE